MRLSNHIANKFLNDQNFAVEIVDATYPKLLTGYITGKEFSEHPDADAAARLYGLVNNQDQTAYWVTDTVLDKLSMLKVKRNASNEYDWSYFKQVNNCKKTFILFPNDQNTGGGCLRVRVSDGMIEFCHLAFNFDDKKKGTGKARWVLFYIDTKDNRHSENCTGSDVQDIYEFVYKILCFIFLSENEYEIIKPGASKGTRKSGKLKNDLSVPITLINSKWNITSIRNEGFDVSGGFAIRWAGVGRHYAKMVFIQPFKKNGYVRGAKSIDFKEENLS